MTIRLKETCNIVQKLRRIEEFLNSEGVRIVKSRPHGLILEITEGKTSRLLVERDDASGETLDEFPANFSPTYFSLYSDFLDGK